MKQRPQARVTGTGGVKKKAAPGRTGRSVEASPGARERRKQAQVTTSGGAGVRPDKGAAGKRYVLASGLLQYRPEDGVDMYIRRVQQASPLQIIELERLGVRGSFIKDLSARMHVPTSRFFGILGVAKATGERKASAGQKVAGSGGQAAIAMAKLVGLAQDIVANSTADASEGFDAARWLGEWIERPQPALGGHRPAELLDTPTGFDVVARLLGAVESGSYQ